MALYVDGKGKYQQEYQSLWKGLVPQSGLSETRQGEVVRVIGRLASEYYRNGNVNWDSRFDQLACWLGNTLNDLDAFPYRLRREVVDDIQKVRYNGENGQCNYVNGEDEYDRLTDRAVEWCQHYSDPISNDSGLPM